MCDQKILEAISIYKAILISNLDSLRTEYSKKQNHKTERKLENDS